MTVQLPARGAFPDILAVGAIAPSRPHLDQHVDDIVESQNWAAGYFGRQHASQSFGIGAPEGPLAETLLLEYLVIPRAHCTTLTWRTHITTGVAAANVNIRIVCLENLEEDIVVSAALVADRYEEGTLEIMREDQLSTIQVYMHTDGGAVTINSFSLRDADLTAADLHFDYYATTATAAGDGLARYWPMQEDDDAGVDAPADDALPFGELTAHNGVTISSEVINGHRKFHRVFGATDYFSGAYAASAVADWTAMIEVQDNNNAGQHTYLALGEGGFAGGVAIGGYDSVTYQVMLEVARSKVYASPAVTLPMTEPATLFVVHDAAAPSVTLYSADGLGTVTQLAQRGSSPGAVGASMKIADGIGAAGIFDAGEELDDGIVRQCAIWERTLSLMEMNAVARHLRYRGALLVR